MTGVGVIPEDLVSRGAAIGVGADEKRVELALGGGSSYTCLQVGLRVAVSEE